jgi:SAM-dependent methyltransferase
MVAALGRNGKMKTRAFSCFAAARELRCHNFMADFARYLESKRSVDDRALNRPVWDRLAVELPKASARPIEVADVGSGTGAGVERLYRRGPLGPDARMTLVEPNEGLAQRARTRVEGLGLGTSVEVRDLKSFAAQEEHRDRFDLVVAHALVDILELEASLEGLLATARPGGLLYLPITFDGETIFEPAHESDAEVLAAYHASMRPSGDGRVGRKLYHALIRAGAEPLELGSSDWVVTPRRGSYPEDEAFFLGFLVDTVEGAVAGRVDETVLSAWAARRRSQIDAAELVFIAHQLDALARKRA